MAWNVDPTLCDPLAVVIDRSLPHARFECTTGIALLTAAVRVCRIRAAVLRMTKSPHPAL